MRGTTKIKRKHRLYIDVTFSSPVSRRDATKGLQLVLKSRLDLEANSVWAYDKSPYIDKLTVIESTRKIPS
jgi:hypothetical protein